MRTALAGFLLLVATAAPAQDWRGMLQSTDVNLRTQHYRQARKTSIKLINSMCDNLGTGANAMYTLGLTVAYRAIAEAGLQNLDDADWYWHVAAMMYPKLTQMDLSPYGEAGAFLASLKVPASADALATPETPLATFPPPDGVQNPVLLSKRDPKYPLGAINSGIGQTLTIRALIDDGGVVRHPCLDTPTNAPTLIYAATEAARQWRYQPATLDGKAFPVLLDLTVHFEPPRLTQ